MLGCGETLLAADEMTLIAAIFLTQLQKIAGHSTDTFPSVDEVHVRGGGGGLIARYDYTRCCVQIRAAAGTRGIFHRLVVTCHAAPSSVTVYQTCLRDFAKFHSAWRRPVLLVEKSACRPFNKGMALEGAFPGYCEIF